MTSGDRVLLVKGRAGLGNRLYAAASALLYGELSGRRVILDWRDGVYAPAGDNAFEALFACARHHPLATLPRGTRIVPACWEGHLDATVSQVAAWVGGTLREQLARMSIDPARLDHSEEVAVFWGVDHTIARMRSHLGSEAGETGETDEAILSRLMREHLVPHAAIGARVDDFRRRHFDRPMIGVHVRFTDHRANLLGILRGVDRALAREPGARLFLATDNVEVLRLFEHVYGDVIATDHWYPPPGQRQHVQPEGAPGTGVAIEALVDMLLLARCDWLVHDSSSSFARISLLLSDIPGERRIDARGRGKLAHAEGRTAWRRWKRLRLFTLGLRLFARAYKLERSIAGRILPRP